jgi:uncharacterized protein (UPF0332 family)
MPDIIATYLRRIVAALRFRTSAVFEMPPVSELEFLGMTGNHGQFRERLKALGEASTSEKIRRYANHVGICWLRLALEHLDDARCSLSAGRARATFSRSYYAAYNASKALRYIVDGSVSLKGDDHPKASSDLPDDFPDVDKWSGIVTDLYEHRLRADYDNWQATSGENVLSPDVTLDLANEFVDRCRSYLTSRLGAPI